MKILSKRSKNQTKTTKVRNLDIRYSVEHRRVRYPRLEFKSNNELLVILPTDISDEKDLLNKKEDWILKKTKEINRHVEQARKYEKTMGKRNIIFGNLYDIKFSNGKYDISINKDEMDVISPNKTTHIPFLKNWLKKELRGKLTSYLDHYSNELGVNYNKLFIRTQKTKWGSCSSRGNLNFNLKLAALPEELIKYVALHEATHLIEGTHNKNFWSIMKKYFSDCNEKESLLTGFWFLVDKNKLWKEMS